MKKENIVIIITAEKNLFSLVPVRYCTTAIVIEQSAPSLIALHVLHTYFIRSAKHKQTNFNLIYFIVWKLILFDNNFTRKRLAKEQWGRTWNTRT